MIREEGWWRLYLRVCSEMRAAIQLLFSSADLADRLTLLLGWSLGTITNQFLSSEGKNHTTLKN